MTQRLGRLLKRRVFFWNFHVPVWTVAAAAVIALGAAAGQAVGPVLAGNVTGTANVTAQQAIVVTNRSTVTLGNPTDKGLVVVNDNGTTFTAALEQHIGDQHQRLNLNIKNNSNATSSIVLQLKVPQGIDLEANSANTSVLKKALLDISSDKTAQTMLLSLAGSNNADLQLTMQSKDDTAPGSYTVSGTLVQISG